MSQIFDYTTYARRFSARFPVLTYLSIQINFWVVANILLGIIMHLHSLSIDQTFKIPEQSRLAPLILIAIILGIFYGIALGLTDHYLDKNIFRKKPLGKVILFKTVISLIVLILLLGLIRYVLFDLLIAPSIYKSDFIISDKSWDIYFIC